MNNTSRAFILASVITLLTGCSSATDEALETIEKLGLTTVYAANGTSQEIIVNLDGTGVDVPDNETIPSFGDIRLLSQFDTPDVYNLSYTINGNDKGKTDIAKNSHTLYAATECGSKEFVQHALNGDDNIYIMNLTDDTLPTGRLDIWNDGSALIIPDGAAACAITSFNVGSTDGQWRVDINGTTILTNTPNFAGANSFVVLAVYSVTPASEAAELTFIAK